MIAKHVTNKKQLMKALLAEETFDRFELVSGSVDTFAEFSVDGERIKGRIEVGAGENVGALGANGTVTVLGAASPAGPFEELGAVEVAEDGSFSLAVAEGSQFFKLRIDVKEVVR